MRPTLTSPSAFFAFAAAFGVIAGDAANAQSFDYFVRAYSTVESGRVATQPDEGCLDQENTLALQQPSVSISTFCSSENGTASGAAYADLTTGEVGSRAAGSEATIFGRGGNGGGATAHFEDTLYLDIPPETPLPVTIGATVHVDGEIQQCCGFTGSGVVVNFSMSEYLPGRGTVGEFDAAQYSTNDPGSYELTLPMEIDFNGVGDLRIMGILQTHGGNGTSANFHDTAAITLQLPEGVTFTSASGVFLSAAEPPLPVYACEGFAAPMDETVAIRGNRPAPLRAALWDDGLPVTDLDLAAPPIVTVEYQSGAPGDPVPLAAEATGKSSEGNQFSFDAETGQWVFNLATKPYSAPGTYTARMVSGDGAEYAVNPGCVGTFVIAD